MNSQLIEFKQAIKELTDDESTNVELLFMLCEDKSDIANELWELLENYQKKEGYGWIQKVKEKLLQSEFKSQLLIPPPEAYFFKLISKKEYLEKCWNYFEPSEIENRTKKLKRKVEPPKTKKLEIEKNEEEIKNKSAKKIENILYMPIQCKICGLRYSDDSESKSLFGIHLEEHKRIERALEENVVSREFFISKKPEKYKIPIPTINPEPVKIVCSDYNENVCSVCSSKLDIKWDDEIEDWIFTNVVEVDNELCHRECVS